MKFTSVPSLAGKRVVVTGSSMGIGKAIAGKLAKEGAKVVINGRNEASLRETANEISNHQGQVITSCGSVADFDYAGQLINACVEAFGGIDGLINCAGIAEPVGTSILDINPHDWQNLIDVHLNGTFNTCRHAAPIMAKQGHGSIINTGSHAFLGMYGGTGYAAGKGATYSLTLAMAMDLKEKGVRVNAVCPGAKTRLSSGEDYEELIENLNQRGLLSDDLKENSLNPPSPDYVAPLYAYLMTENAEDISGRIFWAAGGYLGQFHRNADQILGIKDHEKHPPWTLAELSRKLQTNEMQQPDELYNLILKAGPSRLLVKQKLLVAIGNTRLAKWAMSLQ